MSSHSTYYRLPGYRASVNFHLCRSCSEIWLTLRLSYGRSARNQASRQLQPVVGRQLNMFNALLCNNYPIKAMLFKLINIFIFVIVNFRYSIYWY